MIQYLHVAENLFLHRDPDLGLAIYNIVLHSLVEAKEVCESCIVFSLFWLVFCEVGSFVMCVLLEIDVSTWYAESHGSWNFQEDEVMWLPA